MLLLDELTSFLDEGDQRSVLAAVRAAVDAEGITAVWVRAWSWPCKLLSDTSSAMRPLSADTTAAGAQSRQPRPATRTAHYAAGVMQLQKYLDGVVAAFRCLLFHRAGDAPAGRAGVGGCCQLHGRRLHRCIRHSGPCAAAPLAPRRQGLVGALHWFPSVWSIAVNNEGGGCVSDVAGRSSLREP